MRKYSLVLSKGSKELLPRMYPGNTGFEFQGEQLLASVHASMHESD